MSLHGLLEHILVREFEESLILKMFKSIDKMSLHGLLEHILVREFEESLILKMFKSVDKMSLHGFEPWTSALLIFLVSLTLRTFFPREQTCSLDQRIFDSLGSKESCYYQSSALTVLSYRLVYLS